MIGKDSYAGNSGYSENWHVGIVLGAMEGEWTFYLLTQEICLDEDITLESTNKILWWN